MRTRANQIQAKLFNAGLRGVLKRYEALHTAKRARRSARRAEAAAA